MAHYVMSRLTRVVAFLASSSTLAADLQENTLVERTGEIQELSTMASKDFALSSSQLHSLSVAQNSWDWQLQRRQTRERVYQLQLSRCSGVSLW